MLCLQLVQASINFQLHKNFSTCPFLLVLHLPIRWKSDYISHSQFCIGRKGLLATHFSVSVNKLRGFIDRQFNNVFLYHSTPVFLEVLQNCT